MKALPPLGRLRQALEEATDLTITHVHEDLVFVDNSPFLLRFDPDKEDLIHVHFNQESDPVFRPGLLRDLNHSGMANRLIFKASDLFALEEVPGKEEFRINFYSA